MNRFKFRAWDKRRNEWMDHPIINERGELCFIGGGHGHQDSIDSFCDQDNYELQQWTGLNDINGIPIFEDDIVREGEFYRIVQYSSESGGFGLFSFYDPFDYYWESPLNINCEIKIIGNSMENPDLLEKKE